MISAISVQRANQLSYQANWELFSDPVDGEI